MVSSGLECGCRFDNVLETTTDVDKGLCVCIV